MKNQEQKRFGLLSSLLVAGLMIGGAIFGEAAWEKYSLNKYEKIIKSESPQLNEKLFREFWNLIYENYYDPNFDGINWKNEFEKNIIEAKKANSRAKLYSDVIRPLLNKFPVSHLGILPVFQDFHNQENKAQELSHEIFEPYGGLEIIDIKRGKKKYSIVNNVLPNSAASQAGIEIGWYVEKYNWQISENLEVTNFYGKFKPIIIENNQAIINDENALNAIIETIPSIEIQFPTTKPIEKENFEIKEIDNITYIRFDEFMDTNIIDEIIAKTVECPPNGLIIDLRNNFGGDLMELQRVLTSFLPQHSLIMYTKSRSYERTFHTNFFQKQCKTKTILLIGPSSISAAEIMAQTLQYYKRAVLIGRKTNGSIIGARDYYLSDQTLVQIPVLSLLGPDKTAKEGVGISPDIEIIPTKEDILSGKDIALLRAIEEIKK